MPCNYQSVSPGLGLKLNGQAQENTANLKIQWPKLLLALTSGIAETQLASSQSFAKSYTAMLRLDAELQL